MKHHVTLKKMIASSMTILLATSIVSSLNVFQVSAKKEDIVHATEAVLDNEVYSTELFIDTSFYDVSNLPPVIDLTDQFPIPGDQGQQNNCSAWAVVYALKSQQESKEHGWSLYDSKEEDGVNKNTCFSPEYVFNLLSVNGREITPNVAMDFIVKNGVCPLACMDYNDSDSDDLRKRVASNFKADGFMTVFGIDQIKYQLSEGNGVVITTKTYNDFNNISDKENQYNPVYDQIDSNEDTNDYHTICLIGYDDNYPTASGKGAFKFINSWGTGWGVKDKNSGIGGYGYYSYDMFTDERNLTSSEGLVLVDSTQHHKYYSDAIKTLQEVNIYSDPELTNNIGTLEESQIVWVDDYIEANNGNPPVFKIENGYITAKKEAVLQLNSSFTTIYNETLSIAEIGVFELGKSIEGAKLRFTYTSGSETDEGIVGLAARANDDNWTWLQHSPSDVSTLKSEGIGVESVVEMTYDEFEALVNVEETNIRSYVFQDWGLQEGSNFKIELIAPIGTEVTEVYNSSIGLVKFSPYELGKSIDNSLIRFTYTSNKPLNSGAITFTGLKADINAVGEIAKGNLYSRGEGKEVIATFTYKDLIEYLGFSDDISYIEIQNWALKRGTNLKIELISPVKPEIVNVLHDEVITSTYSNNAKLSPYELGKNIDDSLIRITFTSGNNVDYQVFGVSGKDNDLEWVNHKAIIYSKGMGKETVLTFSYDDFVEYMGIGDDLYFFTFQNMGLKTDSHLKIELITPKRITSAGEYYNSENPKYGTSTTRRFSPYSLGKEKEGVKVRITYIANFDSEYQVLGVYGDNTYAGEELVQAQKAFFSKGVGKQSVYVFDYSDFVTYLGIGDNYTFFKFYNWGVESYKVEIFTYPIVKNYT